MVRRHGETVDGAALEHEAHARAAIAEAGELVALVDSVADLDLDLDRRDLGDSQKK